LFGPRLALVDLRLVGAFLCAVLVGRRLLDVLGTADTALEGLADTVIWSLFGTSLVLCRPGALVGAVRRVTSLRGERPLAATAGFERGGLTLAQVVGRVAPALPGAVLPVVRLLEEDVLAVEARARNPLGLRLRLALLAPLGCAPLPPREVRLVAACHGAEALVPRLLDEMLAAFGAVRLTEFFNPGLAASPVEPPGVLGVYRICFQDSSCS